MRLLVIEDNAKIGEAVRARFALDGHAVEWAQTIADAEHLLTGEAYDLILLDIMLPDGDGRDFLQRRRNEKNRTPVLVLTARSQIADRVRMLDLGADDYVTKPFDFDELMARCRAVLRRQRGSARNLTEFAGLAFDSEAGSLEINGKPVDLRNREMRLLEVFIGAPNRVFPKSYLMDRLFTLDDEASENAIEVYVARLRKKIDGSGAQIDTVRGLGYRLTKTT